MNLICTEIEHMVYLTHFHKKATQSEQQCNPHLMTTLFWPEQKLSQSFFLLKESL